MSLEKCTGATPGGAYSRVSIMCQQGTHWRQGIGIMCTSGGDDMVGTRSGWECHAAFCAYYYDSHSNHVVLAYRGRTWCRCLSLEGGTRALQCSQAPMTCPHSAGEFTQNSELSNMLHFVTLQYFSPTTHSLVERILGYTTDVTDTSSP